MASITNDEAAHLLRRMGFGGSPAEIDDLVTRGREGAVDYLLNYQLINNSQMDDLLARSFDFSNPLANDGKFNQGEIRRWWFTRMITTRRQFEEKITLFWHNHFATSLSKVNDFYMFPQNLKLRQFALVRFDTLLTEVSKDPAMLIWLDNITNVRGRPNENFAREIQELFSLGITDVVTDQPNYTEQDVKEIARAFTGWTFRLNRADPFNSTFFENPNNHDNGAKTIYGETLNFDGEDVIDRICRRVATGRYLVKKLFSFFVYPLTSSAADKATADKFANVYMSSNHSIKDLVRAIFTSDEFFSARAQLGLIKTPVEYVVGPIRMLGANYNPGLPNQRRDGSLAASTRAMGMDVFAPPDVAGWDLNLGWVNTAAALTRFNFANGLASNRPGNDPVGPWLTNDQLRAFTKSSSKKTVKKFLSVLGPLHPGNSVIKNLRNYLESDDQGNKVEWSVTDATIDKKIRGLVHQIMCLPEFGLN
ncbi:MAG TPA: DUF1800 domain-containing protein [Blastocatellia bacterium]|nr:DUF1800 domain-containing protein [Blastocatellia bacterium]